MRNSLPTPNPILRSQKNYSASPDVRLPPPPLPLSGMHACVMCKVRCDAELAWFAEQFCWNRHQNVYYECRIETGRKPNAAPACSAPRARIGRRSEHHSSLERVWRGNLVGSTSVNILTERPSKPHLARNLHACTHRTTYESGSLPAHYSVGVQLTAFTPLFYLPPRLCRRLSYESRRACTMGRISCAVRAYNALCAECGDAGKAFSLSAGHGPAPWGQLDPCKWVVGASTKRTAATFISMFGSSGFNPNQHRPSNQWDSAGEKLHLRAADIKQLLVAGIRTVEELHGTLSLHALHRSLISGTQLVHDADGECKACKIECSELYAALNPSMPKGGRPAKKLRAGKAAGT